MGLKSQQLSNMYKPSKQRHNAFRKEMKRGTTRKRRYSRYSDDTRLKVYTRFWYC